MATVGTKEQPYIARAVERAYFIHGQKGIALRVVEDAWCNLDYMLGKQERHRKLYEHPLGFLKWEERSRPARTTIKLSQPQMLQWLVYEKSDPRERDTECGESPYLLSEEDMIIRYIKHLVQITMKNNSFYVTLGIGRLLHEYGTQEVQMLYDVLTQSDSARMKEMSYLRKQKVVLMDKLAKRFEGMLQTVTTAHGEKRFQAQPTTERLVHLVKECLGRFTPWGTACVVRAGFDPTMIPGLYFSGSNPAEEDRFEVNRIHTMLDPDCFRVLAQGLAQFVKRLPPDSPGGGCDFASPEERLSVPPFPNVRDGESRRDRSQPLALEPEDYLRLQRSREARAHRRKAYVAPQLRVYVDGIERASFDLRQTARVQLDIEPEADVIEVRGQDAEGELALATLLVCCDEIPLGGSFRDWIVLEGGQKVTIQLTPVREASGDAEGAGVEVRYAETEPRRAVSLLGQRVWFGLSEILQHRREGWAGGWPDYARLTRAAVAVVVVGAVAIVLWLYRQPSHLDLPSAPRAQLPPPVTTEPIVPTPPETPPSVPPVPEPAPVLIARASWRTDPEAALSALRIEPMRSEGVTLDLSRREVTLLLNLPVEDEEGHQYTRYRISLVSTETPIWQQTLRAPQPGPGSSAPILSVHLFPQRLPERGPYDLRVAGRTRSGWQELGSLPLSGEPSR